MSQPSSWGQQSMSNTGAPYDTLKGTRTQADLGGADLGEASLPAIRNPLCLGTALG